MSSLISTERSPGLQVVVDVASLGSGADLKVVALASFALDLDVDILQFVD